MRVMLAEDSALLREGIRSLLTDEGHDVVAAYGSAEPLLARLAAELPDVVVLDVRMPPTHTDEGVQAAVRIRERWPEVGILVLSQYVEREFTQVLLGDDARAVGYLLKDRVMGVDDFLDALERVRIGGLVLDPDVVRQLFRDTSHALGVLTEREREVLSLMAEGRTNAGIAAALFVSTSAVEKHSNAIFDKLGLLAENGYNRRVLAILRYLES
ncbi:two component transcriptional regulator, LuxR family [Promicromonospora umidemergens]|uniref:Response regulator transcription factor n=2 Tax=Promicromonospora umidemergens TaxID=629679 RepID=A0ABP8WH22_9MICO|nr:response regulator transcription factor [Promicromonospora umidemergens]MCP2284089.1 two component transcriptional regulator, LuxR family [Promicromonospora umidemergens]